LEFGGAQHGADQYGWQYRPEDFHSEICSHGVCSACDRQEDCWHGQEGWPRDGLFNAQNGNFRVELGSDSPSGDRRATLWLRCEDDEDVLSKWWVAKDRVTNGVLTVQIDGKTVKEYQADPPTRRRWGSPRRRRTSADPLPALPVGQGKRDHTLTLNFHPASAGSSADAVIRVYADVDPWVEKCMGEHFCLGLLGDGTPAGFELRNNNTEQLRCLDDKPMSTALATKCSEWKSCMSKRIGKQYAGSSEESSLHSLLRAAFLGVTVSWEQSRQDDCISPQAVDPEALECECLDVLRKTCSTTDDQTTCYKNILCEHCKVCRSWKQAKGCRQEQIDQCSKEEQPMSQLVIASKKNKKTKTEKKKQEKIQAQKDNNERPHRQKKERSNTTHFIVD